MNNVDGSWEYSAVESQFTAEPNFAPARMVTVGVPAPRDDPGIDGVNLRWDNYPGYADSAQTRVAARDVKATGLSSPSLSPPSSVKVAVNTAVAGVLSVQTQDNLTLSSVSSNGARRGSVGKLAIRDLSQGMILLSPHRNYRVLKYDHRQLV